MPQIRLCLALFAGIAGTLVVHASSAAVPLKNRVLVPWSSSTADNEATIPVSRHIEFVLNSLGVFTDYVDMARAPLPEPKSKEFNEKYLGVVTCFYTENLPDAKKYIEWLSQLADSRVPWIGLCRLGFLQSGLDSNLIHLMFSKFGILYEPMSHEPWGVGIKTIADSSKIGFEKEVNVLSESWLPIRLASSRGEPLLVLKINSGQISEPVMLSKRFAIAYGNYGIFFGEKNNKKWVINPFHFFKQSLALQSLRPIPDVAVMNGNRVFFSHVDGDGFGSLSKIKNSNGTLKYCGEVVDENILSKYGDLPFGVSLIASDVDGGYKGNKRLYGVGRKIFEKINVEPASHTYFHPLNWEGKRKSSDSELELSEGLSESSHWSEGSHDLDLDREITGSISFLNSMIQDRKAKTLYWSGNCVPGTAALAVAQKHNILTINGGDSIYDSNHPSISYLSPLGRPWKNYFQVFAASSNENIYTHGWKDHFYGYRQVIDTFQKSGFYKAIDVYFHFYSAERDVSFESLVQVLNWARSQHVSPVFPSTYIESVHAARRARIIPVKPLQFDVDDAEGLWTLKLDSLDYEVDMSQSEGVWGWNQLNNMTYVFLNPYLKGRRRLTLRHMQNAAEPQLSLQSAEGALESFHLSHGGISGRLAPFARGPLILRVDTRKIRRMTFMINKVSVPFQIDDRKIVIPLATSDKGRDFEWRVLD